MLRETRHKMWPVDRKWALREQSMSLEEFHDLEDVDDEDEEDDGADKVLLPPPSSVLTLGHAICPQKNT